MVVTSNPTPYTPYLTPVSLALAEKLLDTYGSPLYVYEGDRLRRTIQHITGAIAYPHTHFHFASVTNGNIALLKIFRYAGWGLHANTPGDAYLGLHAGFHPTQIIYSGSNLNRAEMQQLLCWGITTLNLDSLAQLQLCCEVWRSLEGTGEWGAGSQKSGFDVSFDVSAQPNSAQPNGVRSQWLGGQGSAMPAPTTINDQPTTLLTQNSKLFSNAAQSATQNLKLKPSPLRLGLRLNLPELTGDSRIGVHPGDFSTAVDIAQEAGLQISGLHFYRGTGTNATTAFTAAIDTVLVAASQLPAWTDLDFGGGFGYPYHHDGAAFDWYQFGAVLSDRLAQLDRPIKLIVEPGRAAIAGCATLLTRVVSSKWQNDKQIVGVDTTVANLSVPSVHGGYREIVALQEQTEHQEVKAAQLHLTDVCGNTTYSRDYLGKNCQLPMCAIDDILAVLDVGAYGYAMSSHFLYRPRPAEVLLENNEHRLIRQRESYSSLIENQVF